MPRYGVPHDRSGRESGKPRHGLTQGLVPCSSFSIMAAVIRAAGETEAVRRDFVIDGLLIAGTDVSGFRMNKASSPLRLTIVGDLRTETRIRRPIPRGTDRPPSHLDLSGGVRQPARQFRSRSRPQPGPQFHPRPVPQENRST